jgi:hypothetical protein
MLIFIISREIKYKILVIWDYRWLAFKIPASWKAEIRRMAF